MRKLGMMLMVTMLGFGAASYASAEDPADATKADNPNAAVSAETKGDLARIHNNYDSAIGYYLSALRATPRNPNLYNKLGITELQLHEPGAANKYFKQALKYDPRNAHALNNLGAVAYLTRKYNPAVRYYKQALALEEENASFHLNIAEAWMSLGQADRAMTEYARALELDADILNSSQEGSIAQVRTPEQRARVAFMIAKAYAKRGNIEGALEYLNRAKTDRYPDLAKVYTDQDFAPVWQDPRLAKIVKRPAGS
jgi:tetratricopeptide (TPR) repeat protein